MDPLDLLEAITVLNDLNDAEEHYNNAARVILPKRKPFDLLEDEFIRFFHVSKTLAQDLITLVEPFMTQPSRLSALSVQTKVMTALHFFAIGSYQGKTGTSSYTGVSQASVSRCIKEVCNALNEPAIFHRFVKFPANMQELQALHTRFFEKCQFPGAIGVIGCTHVAIVTPPRNDPVNPEHVYLNRKNYHSINVQLVCDENLRIINVNARFPGSSQDADIWRFSNLSHTVEKIHRHDPNNCFFLIGHSGYPLRPWLLTPFRAVESNSPEERFSYSFESIRSSMERCNAMLKNRFRCLLRHRMLHYSPLVASQIINACVILHNMCIESNVPEPEVDDEVASADFGIYHFNDIHEKENVNTNADLAAGRALRRQLVNAHFIQD